MEYWDIDEYLAEEEKVTCTFLCASFQNGILESRVDADLIQGQNSEIPIWLSLALGKAKIVSIREPVYFREAFKNALIADPEVFNLRDKVPYLYEHARMLSEYILDTSIISHIYSVMELRNTEFFKISKHIKNEEASTYKKKMSQLELRLFEKALKVGFEYQHWLQSSKKSNTLMDMAFKRVKKVKTN